ncbi:MAG: carboxypeptidase-like regulatory domain-containing protein [Sphingobacteriaceae bacterium]|nr:carboxypeptidase-like regulatory domain-containing protein [Sphingobacteriaceae bacterium]
MKQIFVYFLLLCGAQQLFSQERQVQGIVFDANSKQRLSRVYIYNTSTHKGFYNNTKGEFSTNVSEGDVLVAALTGYFVDTITVKSQAAVIFYLKPNSILLREVIIRDSTLNPQNRLNRNREEYKDAYRKGDTKDILQIGGGNGTGGAGLGIDALWSLLSREGKNARYLQKIIEQDYKEHIINYRYTSRLVSQVTGLKTDPLRDFMEQYRPSYNFIVEANDYALISFINSSFQRYKKHPEANRLPPLVPASGQ